MNYTLSESLADAHHDREAYEATFRCRDCGDVDVREVFEGEPSPCTAEHEHVECLSISAERL